MDHAVGHPLGYLDFRRPSPRHRALSARQPARAGPLLHLVERGGKQPRPRLPLGRPDASRHARGPPFFVRAYASRASRARPPPRRGRSRPPLYRPRQHPLQARARTRRDLGRVLPELHAVCGHRGPHPARDVPRDRRSDLGPRFLPQVSAARDRGLPPPDTARRGSTGRSEATAPSGLRLQRAEHHPALDLQGPARGGSDGRATG